MQQIDTEVCMAGHKRAPLFPILVAYASSDVVMTQHRPYSPVAAGVAASATLEVSTQRDPLTADTSIQVSGCRECVGPL